MAGTVIEDVIVVPGGGAPKVEGATVVLNAEGVVQEIDWRDGDGGTARGGSERDRGYPGSDRLLLPAAVDLHLDNMRERRRPRATVQLDQARVIAALDAECAAAGIAVVCISARCEDAPDSGVVLEDAVELATVVEELAPSLACDWRIHARVEVTDDGAVEALERVLAASSRVALISMMEHSADRTRFASVEEHRRFYAEDWGVPLEQVDEILAAKRAGPDLGDERRRQVAAIATDASLTLASHDDRGPDDVDAGFELGARVAEFPLSLPAARRARELGMTTVLGAPNAVRGQSTSPGNLLATEAVEAGQCDTLCSDYLPSALLDAVLALDARGALDLTRGVDLASANPAVAIGVDPPAIAVGRPLTASLRQRAGSTSLGLALWREGRPVFTRQAP